MNLDLLASLGEFIGGFAVVISLVYVAIQVRQNANATRTENYARILDRFSAAQARLSQDPELEELFSRGMADVSQLSPNERSRFSWLWYEAFGVMEFLFHAEQDGTIPAGVWDRWSMTLRSWLAGPGVQSWWHAHPTPFSRDFTEYVDATLRDNIVPDEAARLRWEEFIGLTSESTPEDSEPAAQPSRAV